MYSKYSSLGGTKTCWPQALASARCSGLSLKFPVLYLAAQSCHDIITILLM